MDFGDSSALADYSSGALTQGDGSTQFITSLLMAGDPSLSLLPADAGAMPVGLTYNVNQYVATSLETAFADFSGLQRASLLKSLQLDTG